jgi:hypothetical protein
LIYRYAHEVLCLLDHEIESQDQIDLLQNLHHFNRFGPGGYFNTFGTYLSDLSPNPEIVPSSSKIFDSISLDSWLTRAWRRRLAQGVRAHFNTLQVLSILGRQDRLIPSNKLAMLANSCDWMKRIDTREGNTTNWSFSACAWVLALSNGDTSFFCQDAACGFDQNAGRAY